MAELVAFLKMLPTLLKLIDKMASAYVAFRIGQMEKDIEIGVRKAIIDHDQRSLENAIGSPTAGKPSGIPGTDIRDTPPIGVRK